MKTKFFSKVLVPLLIIVLTLTAFAEAETGSAEETRWPLEIACDEGELTVYQPQLDSLEKNTISARSAVSVKLAGENEPVFGAVWLTSRLSTDRETRIAELDNIKIQQVRFPEADEEKQKVLTLIVEQKLPDEKIEISLSRIHAMLELAKKEEAVSKDFITTPPEIIFEDSPAVLVSIDGEPRLKQVKGKKLMRVANSGYNIFLDTETKKYYLGSGENWASSSEIMRGWKTVSDIPEAIKEYEKENKDETGKKETAEELVAKGDAPPKIIVATNVAELIVVEGEPEFSPIRGTDLLYVENTEANVFMDINSQKIYLLLSGRWFVSDGTKGPWEYVPSDKLPGDFSKIPPGSAKGNVLAHVAGTEEAKDAVLDSYIPQTAAVNRNDTNLVVAFDGEPEFKEIEGTEMKYAANSPNQVIQVDNYYYVCKDGIWYVTDKLITTAGAAVAGVLETAGNIVDTALNLTVGTVWRVCDYVPPVIYTIPPSCPVYPVTYCRVYEYTPDVVYVGYTPGYLGSYRYGGCIVYGTGYRYVPWCGTYYWPRPCTFGLSLFYNTRSGWSFGFGYGGWYGWGNYAWGCGGWYGYNRYGYGRYWDSYGGYYRGNYGRNPYARHRGYYKHEQNIYKRREHRIGSHVRERRGDALRRGEKIAGETRRRGEKKITEERRRLDPVKKPTDLSKRRIEPIKKSTDLSKRRIEPIKKPTDLSKRRIEPVEKPVTRVKEPVRHIEPVKRNNVITDRNGNIYRKNLDGWQKREKNGWHTTPINTKTPVPKYRELNNQYKARQRGAVNTRRYQQSTRHIAPQSRMTSPRVAPRTIYNSAPRVAPQTIQRSATRPAPVHRRR